jgi:hypothetical protein
VFFKVGGVKNNNKNMNNNLKIVHKSSGEIKQNKSADETALYEILQKLPAPKKEFNLTKDQKKWWFWFGREFLTTKQLTTGDLIHLQNAAVSMDARNKMLLKINTLNENDVDGTAGWVQVFANKTNNVSGYQTMYEKATKQLEDVSAHFGLSFKDRNKLKMPTGDPAQLDFFESFINKHAQ